MLMLAWRLFRSPLRAAQFGVAIGHLLVDGGQLFVGGFQFFLGGFQFFVDALQFLVGGLDFFVGSLEFFVGGFVLFLEGLRVIARLGQLALQFGDAAGFVWSAASQAAKVMQAVGLVRCLDLSVRPRFIASSNKIK